MRDTELMAKWLEDIGAGLRRRVGVLDLGALEWRADDRGNNVRETVWHMARWIDVLERLLGGADAASERWIADGWAARTGYDPRGIGDDGLGVLRKMAPLGLLGGPVPEKYGGIGIDYVSHALVTEEVGRADSSVRTTLSVQISLVEMTILKFGTEEQKQRWLPRLCKGEVIGCFGLTEPEVGSDATKIGASAKRDGDSWVLRGRKTWISIGSGSRLALVFAQGDPSKEAKGITAFVLVRDCQSYGSQALHGKLGLRSSDSSELILDDVRVPDANRLG